MAGKEQHHVWRMLQRGFGELRGSDYHVWIYEKSRKPRISSTRKFGSEKFFYGPEGSDADEKITKFENLFQGRIQDARKEENGSILDTSFCSNLIAHLETRSQFLRLELSNMLDRLVKSINENCSSSDTMRKLLVVYIKNNPSALDPLFSQNLIPISERGRAVEIVEFILESFPDHLIKELFERDLALLMSSAIQSPEIIKNSHNQAILEMASDNERLQALCEYRYSVFRVEGGSFILPDTCCAFIGPKIVSPFSQKDQVFHSVVVPISSEVAIIGRKDDAPYLELKAINRILAGCSYKAFIARHESSKFLGLSARISKYARLITDREMEDICSPDNLISLVGK